MNRHILASVAAGFVALMASTPALAQMQGLAMAPVEGTDGRSETPQMRDMLAQPSEQAKQKLAEARKAAGELVTSLALDCTVNDARLIAAGPSVVNGTPVSTTTYEAACSNGMGYLLVAQPPLKPTFFSCFGVGRGDGRTACTLRENVDLKAMASAVTTHAGVSCAVKDLDRIGASNATGLEYVELNCQDDAGYILAIGLPGTSVGPHAVSCADALMKLGLACRMPANTASANVVTTQTFKDALASHGVACDAQAIHPIGQEVTGKRYVVEFQCSQKPNGLVAFIPVGDNKNAFQTIDCAAASKFGITCRYANGRN